MLITQPPFSTETEGRVELYLYFPFVACYWATFTFTFTRLRRSGRWKTVHWHDTNILWISSFQFCSPLFRLSVVSDTQIRRHRKWRTFPSAWTWLQNELNDWLRIVLVKWWSRTLSERPATAAFRKCLRNRGDTCMRVVLYIWSIKWRRYLNSSSVVVLLNLFLWNLKPCVAQISSALQLLFSSVK